MRPQDLATRLRQIATAIDKSETPNRDAVVREIQATIHMANGADQGVVDFLLSYDNREAVIHELMVAFNAADERFLKDEGYSTLSKLEKDDSDKGKETMKRWEALRRQTELFQNALRGIRGEIAAIDEELYGM